MNEEGAVLARRARVASERDPPHGKLHLQLPNEKCDEKLCAKLPKPPRLTVLELASVVVVAEVEPDEPEDE